MNYISKDQLAKFPAHVIEQAMSTLRAFKEVTISYEYDEYSVSTANCLKAHYNSDHKVFGIVRAVDVYTEDERTQNYIECFHDYPYGYKGKRDYAALRRQYGECPDMN